MKKAMSDMWWILATAFVVIVVVILLLLIFKGGSDKAFGGVSNQLAGFGDCDGDTVSDAFDKCVCQAGPAQYDGCTTNPNDESVKGERSKTRSSCETSCTDNKK